MYSSVMTEMPGTSRKRKSEDADVAGGAGTESELAIRQRRQRVENVTKTLKTFDMPTLGDFAYLATRAGEQKKRRFTVLVEDLDVEDNVIGTESRCFTTEGGTRRVSAPDVGKPARDSRPSLEFDTCWRPVIHDGKRLLSTTEEKFFTEVAKYLSTFNYHIRPKFSKTGAQPGSREESLRHTALWFLANCTTLLVSDSMLGSHGSNGYLKPTAVQVVLPGAKATVVLAFANWLLERHASNARRLVLLCGTNDWLNCDAEPRPGNEELAERLVGELNSFAPVRPVPVYWAPPFHTARSLFKDKGFAKFAGIVARKSKATSRHTVVELPDLVPFRREGLHPRPWALPWICLMIEDVILEAENGEGAIVYDREAAESLYSMGLYVDIASHYPEDQQRDTQFRSRRIQEGEDRGLTKNLIAKEPAFLVAETPEQCPALLRGNPAYSEARREYLEVPQASEDLAWPRVKIVTKLALGVSDIVDEIADVVSTLYRSSTSSQFYSSMATPLRKLKTREFNGKSLDRLGSLLQLDEGWQNPESMGIATKDWPDYFYGLHLRDLVALLVVYGAETFGDGPVKMQQQKLDDDQILTLRLLASERVLRVCVKAKSGDRDPKTGRWRTSKRLVLSLVKRVELTEKRRISLPELAVSLGVHVPYVVQGLGQPLITLLYGYRAQYLPEIPVSWTEFTKGIFHMGSYMGGLEFIHCSRLEKPPRVHCSRFCTIVGWSADGRQDQMDPLQISIENQLLLLSAYGGDPDRLLGEVAEAVKNSVADAKTTTIPPPPPQKKKKKEKKQSAPTPTSKSPLQSVPVQDVSPDRPTTVLESTPWPCSIAVCRSTTSPQLPEVDYVDQMITAARREGRRNDCLTCPANDSRPSTIHCLQCEKNFCYRCDGLYHNLQSDHMRDFIQQ
jgi:hypothetical protein